MSMDEPILKADSSDSPTTTFPSTELVVLLYSIGAVAGLCFALSGRLGSLQTTNCLLLSWVMALAALGMSVFGDRQDPTADSYSDDYEDF